MQKIITLIFLLTGSSAYNQMANSKLIGTFADDFTELKIKADSTFELKTPDYIFPTNFSVYQNHGVWTYSNNVITLNPNQAKRLPKISLTEKAISDVDSIEIKIIYLTEMFENELMVDTKSADFELLTLYLNKPKNYLNIVHLPIHRTCAFAPRVKKQFVVDSSNVIKLSKQKVEKIGMYSYGFEKPIELFSTIPDANYFEITIIQPIDMGRTPRSKQVIIKNKYAYFYELHGKILTSGLLSGLKRID